MSKKGGKKVGKKPNPYQEFVDEKVPWVIQEMRKYEKEKERKMEVSGLDPKLLVVQLNQKLRI